MVWKMARDAVGTVAQVGPRGELLVLAPRMVPPGTRLIDARRDRIGKVVDVIGPVSNPWLIVIPPRREGREAPSPMRLMGREVFRE